MTGYTDVWEYSRGERHVDADWSPIIEDLYSPELDFMDICAANVFPFSALALYGYRMHPHRSLCTLADH